MNRVPAEDKRLENIARYFDDKIQTFGPNPQGVDWKDERGQILRFNSFETLFRRSQGEFSVIDFGCGYGALVDWLDDRGFKYSYLGLDISADMVASAKSRLGDKEKVDFRVFSGERGGLSALPEADFTVASGTFNVKLDADPKVWQDHVNQTIEALFGSSRKGIAINFLSDFAEDSKRDSKRDSKLHYQKSADLCRGGEKPMSRLIRLDHLYSPWEFTFTALKSL